MLAAVAVFSASLAVWRGYSRHVNGPGGLLASVEAAAGLRVALAQRAIWIISSMLCLANS